MSALSILDAAREAPDELALVCGDLALTYGQLGRRVAERLRGLERELRLPPPGPGRERFLVAVETRAALPAIETLLALMQLRVPFLPVHERATASEVDELLTSHAVAGVLRPSDGGTASFDEVTGPEPTLARGGLLASIATSGSTRAPRLAQLSRRAFESAAVASAGNLGWRTGDRWLLCLPLAHVGGLSILTRCLIARRTVVVADDARRREGAKALEATIARMRPTLLSLVPAQLERLVSTSARLPESVRAILVGGAASSRSLLERSRERSFPVLPSYGLTEACSQVATRSPAALDDDDAGCGRPLRGLELRIADGVIELRGGSLFSGYVGEGSPALDSEGWYRTRDLGRLDDEGRLHVLGRVDDVIVSGGENVLPAEVEAVLERCPGVQVACAFGLPDERYGQVVAAALQIEGTDRRGVLDAVRDASRRELSSFKRPRWVATTQRLPLGRTGKLDRTAVVSVLSCRLERLL